MDGARAPPGAWRARIVGLGSPSAVKTWKSPPRVERDGGGEVAPPPGPGRARRRVDRAARAARSVLPSVQALLAAVRKVCLPGLWSQGVKLARESAVFDQQTRGDSIVLRIRAPGSV